MNATVLAAIFLTAFATILLIKYWPQKAEWAYNTVETWRKLIGAAVGLFLAWYFLQTGDPISIILAIGGVSLGIIYFYVEQPQKNII